MTSVPYVETLLESANIFKISKAKTEVKGDMKMSGDCSVHVNVADITIIEKKSKRRLIIPYKLIKNPKSVQPVFGADGYAGELRYPDGNEFKFKVTFPNGEFSRFMDTVVPNVIIARNKEKKAQKTRAKLDSIPQGSIGYVNPNNAGVVYVPVQQPPQPQQPPFPMMPQQPYPQMQTYPPQMNPYTNTNNNNMNGYTNPNQGFYGAPHSLQSSSPNYPYQPSSTVPQQPGANPYIQPPVVPPPSTTTAAAGSYPQGQHLYGPPPSVNTPHQIPDAPPVPDDHNPYEL